MNWRARLYELWHGRPPAHAIGSCSPVGRGDDRVVWWYVRLEEGYTFGKPWRRIPPLSIDKVDVRRTDMWA